MSRSNESEEERLTQPCSLHQDADEQTPILSKTLSKDPDSASQGGNGKKTLIDEQNGKWALVGIAVSTYMGAFCHGLGMFWISSHDTVLIWLSTDGTIMATLSAPIATSFQSLTLLAWLATAYLIASAAVQPLCGKLTDIYSRRTGLLVANILFGIGNLTCGLASERWTMIFGRVLAGVGGGAVTAIGSIVASDVVPSRKRGVWQGIGNLCWGAGNGLGGVFGGYINDRWNWNMAFLLQCPLTVVTLVLIYIYLTYHEDELKIRTSAVPSIRRVDFLGSLSLVATLVVFLLGLNFGGIVSWSHPLVLTSFVVSAVLFCVFIYIEERVASEPIIPVHLILDRLAATTCLLIWFVLMVVYALIFYIPIYFRVRGQSTTASGTALVPLSIATAVGSLLVGTIIHRTGGYKYVAIVILLGILVATILLCTCTLRTPSWLPLVCMALVGAGFGGSLTVTFVALVNAAEIQDQAVMTSLLYTFRSTGAVMGVALASAVFQYVLRSRLWNRFGHRENGAEIIRKVTDSLDEMDRLAWQDRELVRDSYMVSLTAVFAATVGLAVLSLVGGLLLKEIRLHTTLGREDEDEAVSETESTNARVVNCNLRNSKQASGK